MEERRPRIQVTNQTIQERIEVRSLGRTLPFGSQGDPLMVCLLNFLSRSDISEPVQTFVMSQIDKRNSGIPNPDLKLYLDWLSHNPQAQDGDISIMTETIGTQYREGPQEEVQSFEKDPPRSVEIIEQIKAYYHGQVTIKRVLSGQSLSIAGYVNLAIVGEEEQRNWEKDLLNKEHADNRNPNDKQEDPQALYANRISSFEDLYRPQKPIDLDHIFDPLREDKDQTKTYKRLLILGRAGIGKTTLCKHIVHQWLQSAAWIKRFPVIFWIPLREVVAKSGSPKDIAEVIYEHCLSVEGRYQISLSEFRSWYAVVRAQALHLLDGFDEVTSALSERSAVGERIKELMSMPHVLLTSRPLALFDYTFDRRLETMGFTDYNIEKYIQGYYSKEKATHASTLLQVLKANRSIWGIAHIPINLELLCSIWEDKNPGSKLPEQISMTLLYHSVIFELQRRHLKRLNVNCNRLTEKQIRQHSHCDPAMALLKELAFGMMQHKRLLIPWAELESLIDKFDNRTQIGQLITDVLEVGLLKSTCEAEDLLRQDYYFIHLTFQEYLAAEYIADQFLVSGELVVKDESQSVTEYIATNKYDPRLEVMWWLMAGILHSRKAFSKLNDFFDLLNGPPLDMVGFRHIQLLTRCLDESQCDERIRARETLLTELKQWLVHLFDWNTRLDFGHLLGGAKEALRRTLRLSPVVLGKKGLEDFFLQEISQGDIEKKERVLVTLALIKSNWSRAISNEMKIFIKNNPWKDSADILTKSLLDSMEGMPVEEQISLQEFFFKQLQDENVDWSYRISLAKSLLEIIDLCGEPRQTQLWEFCFKQLQDENVDWSYRIRLAISLLETIDRCGESRRTQLWEFCFKQLQDENGKWIYRSSLAESLLEKIERCGELRQIQLWEFCFRQLQDENVDWYARISLAERLLKTIDQWGEPYQTQLWELFFKQLQNANVDWSYRIGLAESLLKTIARCGELHQTQLWEFCFKQLQDENVNWYERISLAKSLLKTIDRCGELHRTQLWDFFIKQLQDENAYWEHRISLAKSLLKTIDRCGKLRRTQLWELFFKQLQDENVDWGYRISLAESLLKTIERCGESRQTQLWEIFFQQLPDENVNRDYRSGSVGSLLEKIKHVGAERQRQIKKIALAIFNDSSLQMKNRVSLALKLIPEVKAEVVIELGAKVLASNLFQKIWDIKPLPQISINKSLHTQASPLLTFFLALEQHSAVITHTHGRISLKISEKEGLFLYEFNAPDAWKSYLKEGQQALYDWLHFVPGTLRRLCEGLGVAVSYKKRPSHQIAVILDPAETFWWKRYIQKLEFSGEYIQALPLIERALSLNSQGADLWVQKVLILDGLKRFSEAQDCLDKAIETNPKRAASYWNKRAWHLCYLNEYQRADECIQESIKLEPENVHSQDTQGWIALFLKNSKVAKQAFDQALSITPEYYLSLQGKGLIADIEAQVEEAKSLLKLAKDVMIRQRASLPRQAEFYYFRAKIFAIHGKKAEAIEAYQKILKINYEPSHTRIRQELETLEKDAKTSAIPLIETKSCADSDISTTSTTVNLLVALKTNMVTTASNLRKHVQETMSAERSDSSTPEFTEVYWDNKSSGEWSDRISIYSQDSMGDISSFPAQTTSIEPEFNEDSGDDQSEASECSIF